MPFKMITLGEKEVGRIAGNALAHAETMASDLTLRWRDQLPAEQEVIDIYQVQMCVRQDLHRMREEIAQIERKHLGLLETESLSRETRDVTIPQLRGKLVGIQNLFDGNFGAGTSTKVFGPLVTTIPHDPFPLRRVANYAHEQLVDPLFGLPPSQLAGVEIQPLDLAKSFEPPLTELDRVLVELEDTLPISNASLERKIQALAELRRQVGIAARFLESLYYLAGHPEVASRVRLSSHRSRRLTDTEGETADEAAGEATGETAGEPAAGQTAQPDASGETGSPGDGGSEPRPAESEAS